MRTLRLLPIAAISLLSLGLTRAYAGTEFLAYEGRNAFHEGQGGNKKTVDGVDFWINGDPPRRFQVLGSIADRRHETGVFGMIRMSALDGDMARIAKANGGDAVILSEASEELTGVIGNGFASANVNSAFATSFVHPMKNHLATYVVVRYVRDEPQASAEGGPAQMAPAAAPGVSLTPTAASAAPGSSQ